MTETSHPSPLMPLPSQVFVADQGTNLCALDLRTGGISYGYKGTPFGTCQGFKY